MTRILSSLDRRVADWFAVHREHRTTLALMRSLSQLGDLGLVWVCIGFFLIAFPSQRRLGCELLLILVCSTLIGEGLIKHLVRRERPFEKESSYDPLTRRPVTYSFPSGHTFSSFAAAQTLALGLRGGSLFFLLAGLIGFSRLYLRVHFLTDVLAGAILGIVCSRLLLPLFAVLSFFGG